MKSLFPILFIFICSIPLYAQSKIKANVSIDEKGNVKILQNNFNITNDPLLINKSVEFSTRVSVLEETSLVDGVELKQFSLFQNDSLQFNFYKPRKRYNSFYKDDSLFILSINYLAMNEQSYKNRNEFDLNISLPKNFELISPDKNDLVNGSYIPPLIIAGKFNNKLINGFNIYTLKESNNISNKRIESIISFFNDCYSFFENKFTKRKNNPKILFVPLTGGTKGKTINNTILFDDSILNESTDLNKRLLAHEIAHLWWGNSSLKIESRNYTEAICEFLALYYLSTLEKEKDYLSSLIKIKNYHTEGHKRFKISDFESNKISRSNNYNFFPLMMWHANEIHYTVNKLSNFYNENKDKYVKNSIIKNFLMEEVNLQKSKSFPDYYFEEINGELFIVGKNFKSNSKVPIEFIESKTKRKLDTITFNENQTKIKIRNDFDKIIIDPYYSIKQFTAINDVWSSNKNEENKSYYTKNKYFDSNFNLDVKKISEEFLEYLFHDDNSLTNKRVEKNSRAYRILNSLKKGIDDNELTISAASYFFRESNNSIDYKFVIHDYEKTVILRVTLRLNGELDKIISVKPKKT